MSYLLVLLVLLMTTFLSSLFSLANGDDGLPLDSFVGLIGSDIRPSLGPVPPGGVGEVPISNCAISFCFTDGSPEQTTACNGTLQHSGPPAGTQLISTNEAVAEVSGILIGLKNP